MSFRFFVIENELLFIKKLREKESKWRRQRWNERRKIGTIDSECEKVMLTGRYFILILALTNRSCFYKISKQQYRVQYSTIIFSFFIYVKIHEKIKI